MIESIKQLDIEILLWINGSHSEFWDNVMWFASEKYTWLPFYGFLLLLLIWKYRKDAIFMILLIVLLITISDQLASGIFKPIFERLRPSHNPDLIDKLGLMGHSFGGYETNFIITNTNIFATAISGAGISDSVGSYFNYNNDWGSIDSWRFENQQYRMGIPFFDNKEAYYRNSPLQNANTITTPLLTWAAKLDENIKPEQGEAFYAALRRLQKEHVMLVYPNDGHVLFNQKNQEDLTLKVKDWFGHYLKNEPKKRWMKADFEAN